MGQSTSTSKSKSKSKSKSSPPPPPLNRRFKTAVRTMIQSSSRGSSSSSRDHTLDIPDECLAIIFHSLGAGDRKHCSLVCRRWYAVDGQSRHRLSLDARAALADSIPSLFSRFDSVSKLALKCNRRSDSITDSSLSLISSYCQQNLTRLKLRACREITHVGMQSVASNCKNLKKLSCGSCSFGAEGIDAILQGCPLLEEISIKRLRGLSDAATTDSAAAAASSNLALTSICLKEVYNGQCFAPLISGSPNLKTLKLFRCSGDWDRLLEEEVAAEKVVGIVEIHLEKLQVSDRGLFALASCSDLEVLHLVKTPECTDVGLSAVADKCRGLRKLHIDGWKTNRIGDEGLMAVARSCPKLQELVLIGVNPTTLSLEMLASNCKNLERLALCGSDTFGDAEMSCIAAKCVVLKKLCIKSCPVSDQGMEALAAGCPNLIKVKVKKCRGVTPEGADWLRSCRESLAVNLDSMPPLEILDASASEIGRVIDDNGGAGDQVDALAEQIGDVDVNIASSSNNQSSMWKYRMGFPSGRNWNFLASTFRRLGGGHGGSSSSSNPDYTGKERE